MALDVVALVVGELMRALMRALMRMTLDVFVDPSLAVLILHRTSSFFELPEPDHLTEFVLEIFHGNYKNAIGPAILRGWSG